jgi:hypothetical protein
MRMTFALVTALLLAGLLAIGLGLVDAGHELDSLLVRLETEASVLHRASSATVLYGAPPEAMTRPRTALRRNVEDMPATVNRILTETAPPYAQWAAAPLSQLIDLVPSGNEISRALNAYVEQTDRARAETSRTEGAIALRGKMLDLNYEVLAQKISEARGSTRRGIGRALSGVQGVTLLSIAIAAAAIGLRSQPKSRREAYEAHRRPMTSATIDR